MIKAKILKPRDLSETLRMANEVSPPLYFLAGGTDILVRAKEDLIPPSTWIDISGIKEMSFIRIRKSRIEIGSLTTHHEVENNPVCRKHIKILSDACGQVGSLTIKSFATIGGNVANASPAGDSLSPLMALDAEVITLSEKGERIIPFDQFFTGPGKTVLKKDEIIYYLSIPVRKGLRGSFKKLGPREYQAISIVHLAAAAIVRDKKIKHIRIALGSVGPTILRAKNAEKYLAGTTLTTRTISRAAKLCEDAAAPIDDLRGSAQYRKKMIGVLAGRALEDINEC